VVALNGDRAPLGDDFEYPSWIGSSTDQVPDENDAVVALRSDPAQKFIQLV
jgi:hypothetical protein